MPGQVSKWIIFGLLLAFHAAMFFAATLILHRTAWELVVPYLITFVAPVPISLLAVSGLRKWEAQRPPPKLLALCWSVCVALLVAAVNVSLFYFGSKFQVVHPSEGEMIFVISACVLAAAVPMYHQVLPVIIARAGTFASSR